MKLRYVAKTTPDGYSFVFRNVMEFKFMAAEKFLSVQLEGKKLELHGITSFEGGGDFEPHLPDFKMIPPVIGGGEENTSGDGLSIVLASRTATFDGVEINVADNSTKDILELLAKSREVYADGRLVKSMRAHSGFEFPREATVPDELATTTFVPLERLGADDKAVKRLEEAVRKSDLRFRSAVVSAIKDSRKMGLVH